MKRAILTFMLTVAILLVKTEVSAQKQTIDIKTSAICEMCQYAIEYELTYTKGVKTAELDLETKKVTIEYSDNKITPEELRKIIASVGYHADDVERDSVAYENLPKCCKDGAHDSKPPKH